MARPKVPLIHKDEVIAMALRIIDEDGLEALSVRRLGQELGVNGASLYHHFADKSEILVGVRAKVFGSVGVVRVRASWDDWAAESARAYRRALLDHPNVAQLMVHHPPRILEKEVYETALGVLLDDGVPEDLVFSIIDSLEVYGFGSVLLEPAPGDTPERGFSGVDERYPALQRALRADVRSADDRFELGLLALIDGWKQRIERSSSTRRRAGSSVGAPRAD